MHESIASSTYSRWLWVITNQLIDIVSKLWMISHLYKEKKKKRKNERVLIAHIPLDERLVMGMSTFNIINIVHTSPTQLSDALSHFLPSSIQMKRRRPTDTSMCMIPTKMGLMQGWTWGLDPWRSRRVRTKFRELHWEPFSHSHSPGSQLSFLYIDMIKLWC